MQHLCDKHCLALQGALRGVDNAYNTAKNILLKKDKNAYLKSVSKNSPTGKQEFLEVLLQTQKVIIQNGINAFKEAITNCPAPLQFFQHRQRRGPIRSNQSGFPRETLPDPSRSTGYIANDTLGDGKDQEPFNKIFLQYFDSKVRQLVAKSLIPTCLYTSRLRLVHLLYHYDVTHSSCFQGPSDVLKEWLSKNYLKPHPSREEKIELARQSGMNTKQVTDWFTNARARMWKPALDVRFKILCMSSFPKLISETMVPVYDI